MITIKSSFYKLTDTFQSFHLFLEIPPSILISVCLSVCLTDCLFVWPTVCLSDCLSDCLTVFLSIYLSICLTLCLSKYMYAHIYIFINVFLLFLCLPTSPLGLWETCSSLLSELVRLNIYEEEFAANFRQMFLKCTVSDALECEKYYWIYFPSHFSFCNVFLIFFPIFSHFFDVFLIYWYLS